MGSFTFENLLVYKAALRWVDTVDIICNESTGRVSNNLLDQLSRAALSIPLNIAEGNGRWHAGDKRQFFWIARGSTFECVPILEVLKNRKILSEDNFLAHREALAALSKMLSGLIKSIENRAN